MFAYCGNNPVRRVDHSGYGWFEDFWEWVKDSAEEAWEDALEWGYSIYYDVTYFHFEERIEKNGEHPTYQEVTAIGSEWILLSPDESRFHDNGYGEPEAKYIHPDGREAVFDGDSHLPMENTRYMATFNYYALHPIPESDATLVDYYLYLKTRAEHIIWDVIPYLCTFKSNTREDFEQKVVAFFELLGG